jgi:hypothetical protein
MDEAISRYLATHDASCPQCSYDLRSVSSATCPECGLQLELSLVHRQVPRAWCVLLVAVSLLSGVGLRRLVAEVFHGMPSLHWGAAGWRWYVLHIALLASPAALLAVLLGRNWLMRRSPAVQWGLVALAFLIFALECLSLTR